MIAKFDGRCKVTGQVIKAGETELVKLNGIWQVKPQPKAIDGHRGCPPHKALHSFEYLGHTCYIYQYKGQYGHWRVWKIEDASGNLLDLTAKYLDLATVTGNRSNIASTAKATQKFVEGHLAWYLDVDGERTKFYAERDARWEEGYLW